LTSPPSRPPCARSYASCARRSRRQRRTRRDDRRAGCMRAVCYAQALSTIGIKVFSATKARDRESLGETITEWIRTHPEYEIFDKIVTQSSDAEFHCLAITVFYRPR